MRWQVLAWLRLRIWRKSRAAEPGQDAGRLGGLRVFLHVLSEDHLACSPCNPKFPECLAVHPDGVVIVGNQERRASAREASQVHSGRQRPMWESGIIPTFYLDPLQLRTLHCKFVYLPLDLR